MASLPAGEQFKNGVIIGREPNGEYNHSGSYRDYERKDSIKLLNPVAELLKKHHDMQLRVDHGTFKVIALFEGKSMDVKDNKRGIVLRLDNNTAHLSVNGSIVGLGTGDWAYIPPGVKCSLKGATLGHTCMGVLATVIA